MPGPQISRPSVFLLVFLLAVSLRAQTASLVKDLSTGAAYGSRAEQITAGKDHVYFVADEVTTGKELWVSDGTAQGTRLLLDGCPGVCDGDPFLLGHLGSFELFLSEDDLWRTDGTADGTYRLAPRTVGSFLSGGSTFFGGALYFTTCAEQDGCALWRTDGTLGGTVQLTAVVNSPQNLTNDGHKLFFIAGFDLWSSDGTAAGTSRIATIETNALRPLTRPGEPLFLAAEGDSLTTLWSSDGTAAGTQSLGPVGLLLAAGEPILSTGGRIYFLSQDGAAHREVWSSDGTAAGTLPIAHLPNQDVGLVSRAGSRGVFVVRNADQGSRLWASQGSPASTGPLDSPCAGCSFLNSTAQLLEIPGNRILFFANDGVHGSEPWVTDGTTAGTHLVADLCPGSCGSISQQTGSLLSAPQGALFIAVDGSHDQELWRSDGTAAGTVRLTDLGATVRIQPQIASSGLILGVPEAALLGNTVYFSAVDTGPALWASERPATTRQVALVAPRGPGAYPFDLTAFDGKLLFVFFSNDAGLWSSQGTAASTVPVGIDHPTQINSMEPTEAGDLLYLRQFDEAFNNGNTALWRTDGTAPGTFRLKSGGVNSGGINSGPTNYQGQLFFAVSGAGHQEIWRSNGTVAGTVKVFDLPPEVSGVHALKGVGADLFFLAGEGEIWKSDGTAAGSHKLADIIRFPPRGFDPQIRRIGTRTIFRGEVAFATDGTAAGTLPLLPAGSGLYASDLTVFQGSFYFFATTAATRVLYRSDGTPAGTVLVKEFPGFFSNQRLAYLTPAFGRLWFGADDGSHGFEPWQSDGTAAGTMMVSDLVPGPDGSFPARFTLAGGRLFFAATDGEHGFEPWQSDGTAAGTRMVQDIASLGTSSFPYYFTQVGDRLYFAADDGIAGDELWSLPLSGPAGCQPSATALCLQQGRYRVEARWRDFAGNAGSGHAVPLTADTGTFWFFDPANTEAIVKILDGQTLNSHVWVFYGALSSVEYTLTVTDTQTGLTRQYFNPPGQLASVGDTHGFGPLGANAAHPHPPASVAAASPLPLVSETIGKAAAVPCQAGAQRLCLNGGRFGVEVAWKDFQNHTGKGKAVPLTGDTGSFWFFDAANVELVVKVLDGRAFNGHFWLFFGALSNVEYTMTVTDSQTGTKRTYKNPSGRFASVADTEAF